MYLETLDNFAAVAEKKAAVIRKHPLPFLVSAMMAGAYVGLGIILIFSVGATLDPSLRRLVMGASFGIALTLVIFAGSDLFTGHTMFMTIGRLRRRVTTADLAASWTLSWLGNLAGAAALAWLFVAGGGGALLSDGAPLLQKAAAAKMNAPAMELFARAILCNWLVCLAIWMAARTSSDAAKLGVIFWCLFAFIASGYEHSVANMTLFSIALLAEHGEAVSLAGMAHNLLWVTLGNAVAGSLFMAAGYWYASKPALAPAEAAEKTALAASVAR